MCTSVWLNGEYLDTPRKLAAALSVEVGDIVADSRYSNVAPDTCLCPCDLQATAAKYGYEVREHEMDVEFYK